LNELVSFVATAAYPATIILVFDWFGKASRRAMKTKSMVMPPDLKLLEERKGRFLFIPKYLILLLILRGLAGTGLWYFISTKVQARPLFIAACCGVAGGIVILAFRHLISVFVPAVALNEENGYFVRGPILLWLSVFIIGGFVEEVWRALCITSFKSNDYTGLSADLITAVAFSIAHVSGLPARVAPGIAVVFAEMLVGLILGALFLWSGNLVVPFMSSIVYFISTFFIQRRSLLGAAKLSADSNS
jgi:membrane protease YdiL (CAAX protease family)